jgi:hypothetical protein
VHQALGDKVMARAQAAGVDRQQGRPRRRHDHRPHVEDLEQPLRRAGGLRDLAPDLGELAQAGGGEHRIEHELREPPRAHAAGKHVLGADPQHHHHAGEHEKNSDGGEDRVP